MPALLYNINCICLAQTLYWNIECRMQETLDLSSDKGTLLEFLISAYFVSYRIVTFEGLLMYLM